MLEIVPHKSRVTATPVVLGQIFTLFKPPSQEAAPQRAVGDEADIQFLAGIQDSYFRIAAPERIFRLQGQNRMNGTGTAYGFRGRFGQSQVADFP